MWLCESVVWEYRDDIMRSLNFHWRSRKWLRVCLSSASMLVLVNGSPTDEFHLHKGLRQGDPLSPFLFLIASEGLSCLMRKAEATREYDGIQTDSNKIR